MSMGWLFGAVERGIHYVETLEKRCSVEVKAIKGRRTRLSRFIQFFTKYLYALYYDM
jgi:hypothetical protein